MLSGALRKVLIVDDDPDARNLLDIALATVAGLSVQVCGSGREAAAAIGAFDPDLVLLDDRMPGADGAETLAMLRRKTANPVLPVVFLTAMTDRCNVERLSALGAASVIAKPFDPMTLGSELRMIHHRATAGSSRPGASAI